MGGELTRRELRALGYPIPSRTPWKPHELPRASAHLRGRRKAGQLFADTMGAAPQLGLSSPLSRRGNVGEGALSGVEALRIPRGRARVLPLPSPTGHFRSYLIMTASPPNRGGGVILSRQEQRSGSNRALQSCLGSHLKVPPSFPE